MNRRRFVTTGLASVVTAICWSCQAAAANRKFVFTIKTTSGGIVGNHRVIPYDGPAELTR